MRVSLRGVSTWERLAAAIALGLVGAAGLVACSSSTSSSASPFAGKTPAQVLAMAKAAALAKGSMHVVSDDNMSGTTLQSVYDASTTQGKQLFTSSTVGNATFLVVSPQMAYAQGDATWFEQNFQMLQDEATKYAGQWIAVPSSSGFFAGLVMGLTVSSGLTGVTPSAPLRFTKLTTIDGKSVVGISGSPGPYASPFNVGTQVLYVSTVAPYLPVANVIHASNGSGKTLTGTDHMSDYGESVSVTAPANSIPISSIPPSTP